MKYLILKQMNIIVRLFIIIVIIIFVMSNVVKQYRHYSSSFWKTQPVMHFSFFNNHRWKAQQKISNKLPKGSAKINILNQIDNNNIIKD